MAFPMSWLTTVLIFSRTMLYRFAAECLRRAAAATYTAAVAAAAAVRKQFPLERFQVLV